MVSDEVIEDGLAALSVAAAELIEDLHDELVMILPRDPQARRARLRRLRKLGAELLALGEAGLVLLHEPPVEQIGGQPQQ